jgi:hypothetical protein
MVRKVFWARPWTTTLISEREKNAKYNWGSSNLDESNRTTRRNFGKLKYRPSKKPSPGRSRIAHEHVLIPLRREDKKERWGEKDNMHMEEPNWGQSWSNGRWCHCHPLLPEEPYQEKKSRGGDEVRRRWREGMRQRRRCTCPFLSSSLSVSRGRSSGGVPFRERKVPCAAVARVPCPWCVVV